MSDTNTSARPRQLTMAGWFVVGGSLVLLVSVFDAVTNLNSVDTRDEVSRVLSSSGLLDVSVSQALTLMRAGLTVAAVCAAAAAVLGFFALQRSRGARLALSIVAVPILLTAPLTGGLVGALVAASTALLWSGPARDWFAGRPVRQPPEPRQSPTPPTPPVAGPADPPAPGAPEISTRAYPSPAQPSAQPSATRGFGEQPVDPRSAPVGAPGWATAPTQPWAASSGPPGPVPVPVRVACLLTWVFSGLVSVMYVALLVVLVVARSEIVDLVKKSPAWEQGNLRQDMLVPVLWVGCLMFLGWSLGACVLAVFTWRRHDWARYLLVGSAGTALVAATFAFPVGFVHQLACAVTIGALFTGRARAWFAAPTGPPPPPGPPAPGGWQPPAPTAQDTPQSQHPEGKPPVW